MTASSCLHSGSRTAYTSPPLATADRHFVQNTLRLLFPCGRSPELKSSIPDGPPLDTFAELFVLHSPSSHRTPWARLYLLTMALGRRDVQLQAPPFIPSQCLRNAEASYPRNELGCTSSRGLALEGRGSIRICGRICGFFSGDHYKL